MSNTLDSTFSHLPKALLFDWDGVFVSDEHHIYESLRDTFTHFNKVHPTKQEVLEKFALSTRDSFPFYFGNQSEEARKYYYNLHSQKPMSRLKETEGSKDLLKFLQEKKIYTAVVSNKRGDILREEAEYLELSHFFACIIGSMDAPRDKPHPDPVFMALEGSGYHPNSHPIWFLGDRDIDMLCAQASRCVPVEVMLTYSKIQASCPYQPKLRITSFQDLIKILK